MSRAWSISAGSISTEQTFAAGHAHSRTPTSRCPPAARRVSPRSCRRAAGRNVALLLGAANTDPGVFGDAPFDITAQRSAQLTFGGGIHHCLGAWLARIEMREALPILASRPGDIALNGAVPSRPHIGITGPIALPLRFTGPARAGQ